MQTIPFRLKAAMWVAFFVILGAWSFVWSTFVHSLPMWGIYAIDAVIVGVAIWHYGGRLLAWWQARSAPGRAVIREHDLDAGTRRRRLTSGTD